MPGSCFLGQPARRTFTSSPGRFFSRHTPPRPQKPKPSRWRWFSPFLSRPFNPSSRPYSNPRTFDSASSAFTLLLTLNAIPFALSSLASYPGTSPVLAKAGAWLRSNFAFTYADAGSKPWTFLTAGFMHANILHIFFNMFTLRTGFDILAFASGISPARMVFLHLYGVLGGSVVAYVSTAAQVRRAKERGDRRGQVQAEQKRYVGASAGVTGVLVTAALTAPRSPIQLMFIPVNFPLAGAVAGWLLLDAYLMGDPMSVVAHEGHLGGALAGALFWMLRMR
ncbi:Hypothetical protein D9617_1g080660 [Elsinoe fawcettii]|nr:Hypothetical protein D9617_1g080660 [Elsinoe fawcettii]